ncbi:site-specific integrase [Spirosoma luteum]|uniref:site-specific integrase n=1 Tax=Spirosoma luteum TaxID=431553 RepID=UPI00037C9838|nr:site-specific integrase [Spirosoma luteum]
MARTAETPISFVLREPTAKAETPIVGLIRFNNTRVKISTGHKVKPAHWNEEKGRVKNVVDATHKDLINTFLNDLEKYTGNFLAEWRSARIAITKETIQEKIELFRNPPPAEAVPANDTLFAFIDNFIKTAPQRVNIETGKPINPRTIQKYSTTVRVLREFASTYKRPIDFDTIDLDFYGDFTAWLTKGRKDHLLSVNAVGKYVQTLKVFLNEATAKGINTKLDYKSSRFKVLKEDADSIYLTEPELQRLYALDLSKQPRLERVRDLFLVGCYTGLRFSDFTTIRPEYIKDGMIRMEQFKTQGKVVIPCHPIVTALLDKYNGQLPKSISNQKSNDYLKEICKQAELNSNEGKAITKGGVRVIRSLEKWQMVSTHTGRRSFATNMYLLGVPSITIMRITGHKTEKAFMRYIKLDEEQHAKIIALHWQKQLQGTPFTIAS